VISSTDGYCTLITFDENELGTVYKKTEVLATVPSPVKPVNDTQERLSVKPVHETQERLSEVKTAASQQLSAVETTSVTEPVSRDGSLQRKKARRVVLQTLSTNVATIGNTEVGKNSMCEETSNDSDRCQAVMNHVDIGTGQVNDVSKITNSNLEPESIDVCGEMQVAKVCADLYILLLLYSVFV